MNDSPNCLTCEKGDNEECRHCADDMVFSKMREENIPDKKDLQKATFREVMEMMGRRSGDGL